MNCLHCDEAFTGNRGAKYCSNKCQQDWQFVNVTLPRFEKGEVTRPHTLKLIMERLNDRTCSVCHNSHWQAKPIPLEVDHIDGDPSNNQPSNLRLICPNCHAQTPTYKSRNRGNGRHARRQRYAEGKSF